MNMSDMAGPMLTGYHDFQLVALSIFVAIRASYAALDLAAGRVTASTGRVRLLLLSGGAFALGIGIWPLHYIGMEAMRLSAMCSYSLIIVALSVVLAVAISLVALWISFSLRGVFVINSQRRKLGSAIVMGLAILRCTTSEWPP